MAKVVDLTEKLDLENPRIRVGDKEYELKADARSVLLITEKASSVNMQDLENIKAVGRLLIKDNGFDEILDSGITFRSLVTLIETCIKLVTGADDTEGEL